MIRVTVAARALRHSGRISDGWSALAKSKARLMVENVVTAKTEVVDEGEFFHEEFSPEELDTVSGGWSIDFGIVKITGSDVADAAKWVWNHAK